MIRRLNRAWKDRIENGYFYVPGSGWKKKRGENILIEVIQRSSYLRLLRRYEYEYPNIIEEKK